MCDRDKQPKMLSSERTILCAKAGGNSSLIEVLLGFLGSSTRIRISSRRMSMSKVKFWVIYVFVLACLPGTSLAQYSPTDSGQFVILGAQYGTAARHVDVTNRLKELARADRVFRMTPAAARNTGWSAFATASTYASWTAGGRWRTTAGFAPVGM